MLNIASRVGEGKSKTELSGRHLWQSIVMVTKPQQLTVARLKAHISSCNISTDIAASPGIQREMMSIHHLKNIHNLQEHTSRVKYIDIHGSIYTENTIRQYE